MFDLLVLKVGTNSLWKADHTLAVRDKRKYLFHKMCSCFYHTVSIARGTNPSALTGKCDQKIFFAIRTVRSSKSMRKNTTFEIGEKRSASLHSTVYQIQKNP